MHKSRKLSEVSRQTVWTNCNIAEYFPPRFQNSDLGLRPSFSERESINNQKSPRCASNIKRKAAGICAGVADGLESTCLLIL